MGFSIRGTDYEYPANVEHDPDRMEGRRNFTGVGGQTHEIAADRPPEIYDNEVTLHTGPDHPSSVLLPIVPDA